MWVRLLYLAFTLSTFSSATHLAPVPSNKLLGTVIVKCGISQYHTPPDVPYPTGPVDKSNWIEDNQTQCLKTRTDVLSYCQRIYNKPGGELVQRAIPNPFTPSARSLSPDFPRDAAVFLCLGAPFSPSSSTSADNNILEITQSPSIATVQLSKPPQPPHLPTLMDVHKAYFSERFRQLSNATRANISLVVNQVLQDSKGLSKLRVSAPLLAQYKLSLLLKLAHEKLVKTWVKGESQWGRLEKEYHEDMVRQLQSEDWASEKEFTYALQEFTPDLGRIQDALARLLSRLADSVDEEIRHLSSVQSHQPWSLALGHTNWTNHVTNGFVSIEKVHAVLLKYVHTATLAINTVRAIVSKKRNAVASAQHLFKREVESSYNNLQSKLFKAEQQLNHAKNTLLLNVTSRMHDILEHMNNQSASATASDVFVSDWLSSKHHSELAFIDLLIMQLFGPYVVSDQEDVKLVPDLWVPAGFEIQEGDSIQVTDAHTILDPSISYVFITCVIVVAFMLFFVICLAIRRHRRLADQMNQLFNSGLLRLKHAVGRSRLFGGATESSESPVWKVERRVIVMADPNCGVDQHRCLLAASQPASRSATDELAVAKDIQGYMNLACAEKQRY